MNKIYLSESTNFTSEYVYTQDKIFYNNIGLYTRRLSDITERMQSSFKESIALVKPSDYIVRDIKKFCLSFYEEYRKDIVVYKDNFFVYKNILNNLVLNDTIIFSVKYTIDNIMVICINPDYKSDAIVKKLASFLKRKEKMYIIIENFIPFNVYEEAQLLE